MKRIDLSKLKKLEANEEKYKKAADLYVETGMEMFRLDALFNCGILYELPMIPYAGDLSEGCYLAINEDTKHLLVYHMNGYIQPVFSMCYTIDGIICKRNDNVPEEYMYAVCDYIKENLIIDE